jgi:hypothetical protein
MTTYTDRITLVFPIAAKNRQAAASLQTLEITESGKEFETLVPLDPALVNSYADEFNLASLATITQLTTDLAEANAKVEPLETQVASLTAQLEALLNPPGPDVTTAEGLKAYLSNVRYEKEISGFNVGSQFVSTNRDELAHWFARFFDAFNWLQGNTATNPSGLYPYKPKGGSVVAMLTAEQAVRAYQCLAYYVNMCIATEGQLIEAIDGGMDLAEAKAMIDNVATWPQRQFDWVAPE